MKRLLLEYYKFHLTTGNQVTHFIGIPLIIISLLGLLSKIHLFNVSSVHINAAHLLFFFGNIYYLINNLFLGLVMFIFTGLCFAVGAHLQVVVNVFLFLVGWFFQLYGHKVYEKNSPAFLDNLIHLFVGPAFIMNKIFKIIKIHET